MVNDIKDGSADMIVTALTILYSRKYVIDFLHPIMPEIGGKDFPSLIIYLLLCNFYYFYSLIFEEISRIGRKNELDGLE